MKKFVKTIDGILAVICAVIFVLVAVGTVCMPKNITFYDGSREACFLKIYNVKETDNDIIAVSGGNTTRSSAEVSLFGIIPVNKIAAESKDRKYVRVGGDIIGIRMYTEGLMVVGVESVDTAGGSVSPGSDCGILSGDIITKVNGENVASSAQFGQIVSSCGGKSINITVKRNSTEYEFVLQPVYSETENKYRCGLWLRDSTAGIGTLTFSDSQTHMFASLGHAICDSDTNSVIPVGDGDILEAVVKGCTPGEKGSTGQIHGSFVNNVIGKLVDNNEFGVYGTYTDDVFADSEIYPVASQSEVKTGEAKIITTVTAEGKKEYDIEIEKITYSNEMASRSIVIRVTDPELLAMTGGIVQGMSGSPIIQNGMLVGAVTHVFLNNPECGYGVFAETMIAEAEQLYETKAAS